MSEAPNSLWSELKRRRVVRVAIGYAAAAFAVLQGADLVFPALDLPEAVYRRLVIVTLVGFPLAVTLAWMFDLTPEGLRRADASGGIVLRRRWMMLGVGGVAGLALLAAALLWGRPSEVEGSVSPGADVIAVLPFRTTGSELSLLGEGVVDLLSRSLDGVGAIRTIDARTVLYHWSQAAHEGEIPRAAELQVGRDVGAGSILTGSITDLGGTVQMDAELFGIDGTPLASASIQRANVDDMFRLVDELGLAILEDVWQSARPIPRLDVTAITTGELEAVRSFLEGERLYRASQWDAALAAFARAVEADSTFALAWFRIASTLGWAQGLQAGREDQRRDAARRAADLADRLPPREAALARVTVLGADGQRDEAIAALRAHVESYPDDVEAWYLLADEVFHSDEDASPARRSPETRLELFDRAVGLDPSFATGLIHPLEVAFEAGDTARIGSYLSRLERIDAVDTFAVRVYREGLAALGAPDRADVVTDALDASITGADSGLGDLAWQASKATLEPLLRIAVRMPLGARQEVSDGLMERRGSGAAMTQRETRVQLQLRASSGRLDDVERFLSDRSSLTPSDRQWIGERMILAGLSDLQTVSDRLDLRFAPGDEILLALLTELDRPVSDELEFVLEEARERADERPETSWPAIAEVAELLSAFDAANDGARLDSAAVVLRSQSLFDEWVQALWMRWYERAALADGSDRAELDALERPWPGMPLLEARRLAARASALRATGRRADADRLEARLRASFAVELDPAALLIVQRASGSSR